MRAFRWIILPLSLVSIVFLYVTCALVVWHPALLTAARASGDNRIEEAEQRRVAAHEAGHAVVCAVLLGPKEIKSVTVNTLLIESSGVYGVMEDEDHNRLQTAEGILKDAAIFMAGRAADKIVNGAPTNGATSDIINVNKKITRMHIKSGLGDSLLTYEDDDVPAPVVSAIERDINRANACAEAVVEANKAAITALAGRIMEVQEKAGRRTLSGDEFRAFLKDHPLAPAAVAKDQRDPCAFGPGQK